MRSKSSLFLLVLLAAPASAAISTTASGVYDENTVATNTVDNSAPGSADLTTFKLSVSTAYAANLGGVVHFDDIATTTQTTDALTVTYGASLPQVMTISKSPTLGNYLFEINAVVGSPISGGSYIRSQGVTGNAGHSFNFSTGLTQLGFTVLTRTTGSRTVTATVTYSDATTAILTDTITANASPSDDTFFGFIAPAGKTIQSVTVVNSNPGDFFAIDDLAFIVPEPSSVLLGAAGFTLMATRRRRS